MRRTISLVAAWSVATLVAIAVAATAVASVRTGVTDTPTALGAPSIVVVTTAGEPEPAAQSTSTTVVQPETTATLGDPAPVASTTKTTVVQLDASSGATVTTTDPPQVVTTVATTSTSSASYGKTYDTAAGSVRIVVSSESVAFSGATPLPGWTVELENGGPEEVRVHFERNEDEEEEIEFKATIDDGELKVSISEDGTEDEPKEESEDD